MEIVSFGSVCSGVEAASLALEPIGFKAAWFAEIDSFPAAVLAHHFPEVPNLGDMTKIAAMVRAETVSAPDVLIGGTPCQAFSIAGLREGLSDPRGGLTLSFVELANAIDDVRVGAGRTPAVIWWENVPGVLSSKDNAFGCFLGALCGESSPLEPSGDGWTNAGCVFGPQRAIAWRTLDAQYFGLAQRRRRVFVVASARQGFNPAELLFEFEGVRRDFAPSREAREDVAGTIEASISRSRGAGTSPGIICLAHGQGGAELAIDRSPTLTCNHEAPIVVGDVAGTLTGSNGGDDENDAVAGHLQVFGGNNTSGPIQISPAMNANRGCHNPGDFEAGALIVIHGTQDPNTLRDMAHTLGRNSGQENVLCFDTTQVTSPTNRSNPKAGDPCHSLAEGAHPPAIAYPLLEVGQIGTLETVKPWHVLAHMSVRRLMPVECERLQGMPDNWTLVPVGKKMAADDPRYKAIGNSMAVPVMAWIGKRLLVELQKESL